jgi:hypothetical protein
MENECYQVKIGRFDSLNDMYHYIDHYIAFSQLHSHYYNNQPPLPISFIKDLVSTICRLELLQCERFDYIYEGSEGKIYINNQAKMPRLEENSNNVPPHTFVFVDDNVLDIIGPMKTDGSYPSRSINLKTKTVVNHGTD